MIARLPVVVLRVSGLPQLRSRTVSQRITLPHHRRSVRDRSC